MLFENSMTYFFMLNILALINFMLLHYIWTHFFNFIRLK